MIYNQLSNEKKMRYEDMAKEPFHQMFHRLVQATDKGKCMLCKFSSGRKVLSFNKRLEWDGEYLAHIRQTHGLQPDDFHAIIQEVLLNQ